MCSGSGEAVTFSGGAVLLRPDPLPQGRPSPSIEVEFALASGLQVTTPIGSVWLVRFRAFGRCCAI